MRDPRLIIPGYLTEVNIKTFQGRFFFIPRPKVNELVVGVLARAQQLTDMTICHVRPIICTRRGGTEGLNEARLPGSVREIVSVPRGTVGGASQV